VTKDELNKIVDEYVEVFTREIKDTVRDMVLDISNAVEKESHIECRSCRHFAPKDSFCGELGIDVYDKYCQGDADS